MRVAVEYKNGEYLEFNCPRDVANDLLKSYSDDILSFWKWKAFLINVDLIETLSFVRLNIN